jgi:hypothetical protein
VYLRGKVTFCSKRSTAFPVPASTPEGVRTEPPSRRGQAPGAAEPDARGVVERVSRTSAEASVRHVAAPQVATQTRTSRQRASPVPGRSPKRVLPRRRRSGVEATLSELAASRETLEGSIGEGMSDSTCRSGCSRAPSPGGCLPPASHRGGPRAQDTQRECEDISHGVRILSAFEPRRSLRRFTSPAPSALRVSHPLSGLSPPGPRGFVSRHIRP